MANLILRPANRDEVPYLARLQNAANANSVFHHRMAPGQIGNPEAYYQFTLLRQRVRIVSRTMRYIVAEDSKTGEVLGFSIWASQGPSALDKRWRSEAPRWWELERRLLQVENLWSKYVVDKVSDWGFVENVMKAVYAGAAQMPPCLHLWVLATHPRAQGKGVGTRLMDWGKRLATEERLPLMLESNLEAVGFYEKMGMRRMDDLVVMKGQQEDMRVPSFAWEAEDGKFLEENGDGRWKWKKGEDKSSA